MRTNERDDWDCLDYKKKRVNGTSEFQIGKCSSLTMQYNTIQYNTINTIIQDETKTNTWESIDGEWKRAPANTLRQDHLETQHL